MECVNSGLDIFKSLGLQTSVESGEWSEYRPVAALDQTGPLEYSIPPSALYYDLSNCYLRVRVRVTRPDGANLAAPDDTNLVPTNLFLHSLFSEVDVFLNSVQISSPSGCYPYVAYLQTLLTYCPEVKETQLAASGYFKDVGGHMEDQEGDDNDGMLRRKRMISESKTVELVGRLHADIFHQDKYLLNHVGLRIKLFRSNTAFLLKSSVHGGRRREYAVNIVEASFFARGLKISPSVQLSQAKVLETTNAVYPITRTKVRVLNVAAGSFSFHQDNLWLDKIPNRMVVTFVRSDAFNGSLAHNPFNFQHFRLNFLCLYHQGQQIPTKGLTPNFEEGQFTRAYFGLFQATNTAWENISHGIRMEDFAGGYAIYCFDLTPSLSHPADTLEVAKPGPIRLEANFAAALTAPIVAIIYGEFDSQIEISKSREVMLV